MHEAATAGYESLVDACKKSKGAIDTQYPAIPFVVGEGHLQGLPKHDFSCKFFHQSIDVSFVPLETAGDGNCLYRYVMLIKVLQAVFLMQRLTSLSKVNQLHVFGTFVFKP